LTLCCNSPEINPGKQSGVKKRKQQDEEEEKKNNKAGYILGNCGGFCDKRENALHDSGYAEAYCLPVEFR
jgi:hypothetical protein